MHLETKPEISKMLTVSTGHLPAFLYRIFRETPDSIPLAISPEGMSFGSKPEEIEFEQSGWRIFAGTKTDDMQKQLEKFLPLHELAELAWSYGCEWICLDNDGPRMAELNWYDTDE